MSDDHVRKSLLTKYPSGQEGVWQIYGEDPNCDLGGSHIEPHLETVSGRYADVVDYALKLNGFFTWGSGGRIVPYKYPNVKQIPDRRGPEYLKALCKEKEVLLKRLTEIELELKELDVDYE